MDAARVLLDQDFDALMSLYDHLHSSDEALPAEQEVRSTWKWLCESPDHLYFGVDLEGLLVASCTVAIVPNLTRGARPYGLIENVVTHGDYRRRGLGRVVVSRAVAECRSRRCYKVMLMSASHRHEVHSFYEALGFDRDAKQAFIIRL